MSAFVVSRDHVDAMVAAGLRPHPRIQGYELSWFAQDPRAEGWNWEADSRRLALTSADDVGQMLTDECVRSVSYRYADNGDLPGCYPDGEPDWMDRYHYPRALAAYLQITPVQVLKLIDCYEYQACEHPGWRDSEAWQFCDALRGRMISALAGYDEASWEWEHSADCARIASKGRVA